MEDNNGKNQEARQQSKYQLCGLRCFHCLQCYSPHWRHEHLSLHQVAAGTESEQHVTELVDIVDLMMVGDEHRQNIDAIDKQASAHNHVVGVEKEDSMNSKAAELEDMPVQNEPSQAWQ